MQIKNLIAWLCIVPATLCTLQGCTNEDPSEGGSTNENRILKLERLDITGAKALALTGNSTMAKAAENDNALFIIDAEGNMSAALLYVTESDDGSSTTTRTDISVHPRAIYNFSNSYTYFFDCSFTDKDGYGISMGNYYPGMGFYFNILVQNSTGKIYCVPEAAQQYFPQTDQEYISCTTDKAGNLYLSCSSTPLVKVTFSSDEAIVSTYGPEEHQYIFSKLYVLDNGTLISIHTDINGQESNQSFFALYPNGGYETAFGTGGDEYNYYFNGRNMIAAYAPASNFATEWNGGNVFFCNEEVSVSIVPVIIGTQFGSISVGTPIATLTGKNSVEAMTYLRQPSGDWTDDARDRLRFWDIYETDQYYFIGKSLAYDKQNRQWRDMVQEGLKEHIIFPDHSNVYHGKAWKVYVDCADWFDMESFTYGRVTFPAFDNCSMLSEIIDIPNGQFIRTMRSPVDGKKHIFTINIETGTYTDTSIENNAETIRLIPLN